MLEEFVRFLVELAGALVKEDQPNRWIGPPWDGQWRAMPGTAPTTASNEMPVAGTLMIGEENPVTWETPHACGGIKFVNDGAYVSGKGKAKVDGIDAIVTSSKSHEYQVGFIVPEDFKGYKVAVGCYLKVRRGTVKFLIQRGHKTLEESEPITKHHEEAAAVIAKLVNSRDDYYGIVCLEPDSKVAITLGSLRRLKQLSE
jgi:hypothetical protein